MFCAILCLQAMIDQPDLVDDTFLLAGRAAAYCPRLLLVPQLLPPLLDTAMVSCREILCAAVAAVNTLCILT
jgi:transportin-3